MIRARVLFIFIAINGLLLAASFAIGLYAHHAAGRYLVRDSLLIMPPNSYISNAALAEKSRIIITKGERQTYSPVIFCNPAYFSIHFMHFIEGGPWHISENQSQLVILNEALAWYLFGGGDITGLTVEIEGTFFQIIGVVRQGAEYMAWLPNGGRSTAATSMYLRQEDYFPISELAYTIIDVNRYIESIGQRFRLLLYIILIYLLVIFVQKGKATPVLWVGAAICLVMLTSVNEFLLWLPNLSGGISAVFADLTNVGVLPSERYLSYGFKRMGWLNGLANFAWVIGIVGVFNLIFAGVMVKDG